MNSSLPANATRLRTSLRSLFQSVLPADPCASLLISTGVRPFDKNSRAKLEATIIRNSTSEMTKTA